MNEYEIKKVIAVNTNLSLGECEKILVSRNDCLGILDENCEISGFVIKEDLYKVLKFDIKSYPINIITTLADCVDINIENIDDSVIKRYFSTGLNKGVFAGKDKKHVDYLILNKNKQKKYENRNLSNEYETFIPSKIRKALEYCYTKADQISLPIYLVGGIVRDIIISSQGCDLSYFHKKFIDADITVETNAIEFSKILANKYKGFCEIKELHEDFKTAKLSFIIDDEIIELDIASTRRETYQLPASLPTVEDIGCSIYDDLIRRDFTINAMALSLNQKSFCHLIDHFDGYNDIEAKIIKILHPVSFIDDPTRIIRAIKFGTRLNYNYDRATEMLIQSCINSGIFDNIAGERIKSEIKQTFNQNKSESFEKFVEEKAFVLIDRAIEVPENVSKLAKKCMNIVQEYHLFLDSKDFIWLIYLGILLIKFEPEKIVEISNRLYLSGMETEVLIGAKSLIDRSEQIKMAQTRFEIYELLEGYFAESVLIALTVLEKPNVENKIALFQKELKNASIYTTGKILIEGGLIPGPVFGEILRELLKAKVNGEISTQEDEIKYIKNFSAKKFIN
jgi:tRNA nucleotidyltransferase (CCA-adding enzyme)